MSAAGEVPVRERAVRTGVDERLPVVKASFHLARVRVLSHRVHRSRSGLAHGLAMGRATKREFSFGGHIKTSESLAG
jgi:hypothetical protein